MLTETKAKSNKENASAKENSKHINQNVLKNAINTLQEEITSMKGEAYQKEKHHNQELENYRKQIDGYRKKLNSISQKYIVNELSKPKANVFQEKSAMQALLREKDMMNQQLKHELKKCEQSKKELQSQNYTLKKQIMMIKAEKQKNMEIGVMQKIQLEQRSKILEEEVNSKKGIILFLKKQLDRIHENSSDVNIQERKILQKAKELEKYEKQAIDKNNLSNLRFESQIEHLSKQNQFLKKHIKKIQKIAKAKCGCELQDQKIKENLFETKRELTLAKVQLGRSLFNEQRKSEMKAKLKKQGWSSDSDYSTSDRVASHKK